VNSHQRNAPPPAAGTSPSPSSSPAPHPSAARHAPATAAATTAAAAATATAIRHLAALPTLAAQDPVREMLVAPERQPLKQRAKLPEQCRWRAAPFPFPAPGQAAWPRAAVAATSRSGPMLGPYRGCAGEDAEQRPGRHRSGGAARQTAACAACAACAADADAAPRANPPATAAQVVQAHCDGAA
jgi:hypothetical protein